MSLIDGVYAVEEESFLEDKAALEERLGDFRNYFVSRIKLLEQPKINTFLFTKLKEMNENHVKASILLTDFGQCFFANYESSDNTSGQESLRAFQFGYRRDPRRSVRYRFSLLENAEGKFEFRWSLLRERLRPAPKTIDWCFMELKSESYISQAMDTLIGVWTLQRSYIRKLQEENSSLKEKAKQAINDLEIFTEEKQLSIRELYNRFSILLNSKKRRINELLESGYTFTPEAIRTCWNFSDTKSAIKTFSSEFNINPETNPESS